MAGKVVIVTGSSSGIGFATLQHLARMGAKVYMTVPDEPRTGEALDRVEREGREPGMGEVIWHKLDLKDPREAKASAEAFLALEDRLDILVNNAALITDLGRPTMNPQGVQDNMAINYLGPYVFTKTLLPLLERTAESGADVRIVNVGSHGHADVNFHKFGSLKDWNHKFPISFLPTLSRYKFSKLAVHLWSNDLSKTLQKKGSRVILLISHPGAILSDGAVRSLKTMPFSPVFIWGMSKIMFSQTMGAYSTVFAACAPRDNGIIENGAYIFPPNVKGQQAKNALNEKSQKELADATEKILAEHGI